ncbi:MAG: hypothetical protein ACP2W7_00345 [Buchnera aphidicola (Tetraneura sorini)]
MLLKNLDNFNKINSFRKRKRLSSIFYPKNKRFKNIYKNLKNKKYLKFGNFYKNFIFPVNCASFYKNINNLKLNFSYKYNNNSIDKINRLDFCQKKNNWTNSSLNLLKKKFLLDVRSNIFNKLNINNKFKEYHSCKIKNFKNFEMYNFNNFFLLSNKINDNLLSSLNYFEKILNKKIFISNKNDFTTLEFDKNKSHNNEKNIDVDKQKIFFCLVDQINNKNNFFSIVIFKNFFYETEEFKTFFLEQILNNLKKNKKKKLKVLIISSNLENILVEFNIKSKKISLNLFSNSSILCSFLKSFLPDLKKRLKKNKIFIGEVEIFEKNFFDCFKIDINKNKSVKPLKNNFYKIFENKYCSEKNTNFLNLIKKYQYSNVLLHKNGIYV